MGPLRWRRASAATRKAIAPIDAEFAEKGHLWTETSSGAGGMSRQPVVKPFIEREGNPEIARTDTQLNFRFQAAVKISAAGY
jgi:hypothetical protein